MITFSNLELRSYGLICPCFIKDLTTILIYHDNKFIVLYSLVR